MKTTKEIKNIAEELQRIIKREIALSKRDDEKYRIAFNSVMTTIEENIQRNREYIKQYQEDNLPLHQLQCENAIMALIELQFEIEKYIKPSEVENED